MPWRSRIRKQTQLFPLEGSGGLRLRVGRLAGHHARQQPAHMAGLLVVGGDQPVERLEVERERRQPARFRSIVGRADGRTLRLNRQFSKGRYKYFSRPPARSTSGAPAGDGCFSTDGD